MKKFLLTICSLVLAVSLFACSNGGGETEPAESGEETEETSSESLTFGLAMNDMSNPFIAMVGNGIEEAAKAEGNVAQIADAASNPQSQISQIENFVTMGVDAIFIFAVDPTALVDVVARAHDAGIPVLTAGGSVDGADLVMNVDQELWGRESASMFTEWANETFGADAAGKKVFVFKDTSTDQSTLRSNGIESQLKEDGFEPIVVAGDIRTSADGRSGIENMWQQNSDAIGLVAYNADAAGGANEFIMGLPNVELDKFAIFSCDTSDEIAAMINLSKDNSSVFRGTVGIGGPIVDGEEVPLPDGTYTLLCRLARNEDPGYSGDNTARILPE